MFVFRIIPISLLICGASGLMTCGSLFAEALNEKFPDPRTSWKSWPARISVGNVEVAVSPVANGKHVYTTRNFRFVSNVSLSSQSVKDLARIFELTHSLHAKSPFGIQANPVDGYFQAEFFGRKRDYLSAGGPPDTTGVYLVKDRKFLAPLELMGMESSAAGWRRGSRAAFDPTPIVHELTHMLSHDILANLPLWLNEGYAEYISNIPISVDGFDGRSDRIKARILALLASEDRVKNGFTSTNESPRAPIKLVPVSSMLAMSDPGWRASKTASADSVSNVENTLASVEMMRRRYRTAHLIIYYHFHIEGDKGVARLFKLLEENRGYQGQYEAYLAKFKVFQTELDSFKKLPGVVELPDKKIEYPASLTPPEAPSKPFANPDQLKLGGIQSLLDHGDAKAAGTRIEEALKKDLGIAISFTE